MGKNFISSVKDEIKKVEYIWSKKNNESPENVSVKSHKVYYWYSNSCKHDFPASPRSIFEGTGCSYCSGREVLYGFNDLTTTDQIIMSEWDYKKNIIDPKTISRGSRKKVHWKCKNDHEWESTVKNRIILKRNCAVCSGVRILSGNNDVLTLYPQVSSYWDYDKNKDIDLSTRSTSDRTNYWFKCSMSHSYQTTLYYVVKTETNGCPFCNGRKVLRGFNDLESKFPILLTEWNYGKNKIKPDEITFGSCLRVHWKCKKGHEWDTRLCDRTQKRIRKCPKCVSNISVQEKELSNYIKLELEQQIISSDRKILNGKEIDILIPDKKIAIEFNGLYWHSESSGKDKAYHYDKWIECKRNGIQLITIWEDDWRDKNALIKRMLTNKLNLDRSYLNARDTYVKNVKYSDNLRLFVENNHIQGFVNGTVYLGLFNKYNSTLVAVMILKKDGSCYNLLRFCSLHRVNGGHSKMLKYFIKNYNFDEIITFADHEISDGNLYEVTGWEKVDAINPDYKYIFKSKREHKFNFRKSSFKNNSELLYQEGLTESQLADLNGLDKVWDCGKTKYKFKNQHFS